MSPTQRISRLRLATAISEGAASGTIMIGERPETEAFKMHFDWPDAVVHLDYDSSEIDRIIDDLDRQPEKQERIRRTNVVQSLLRHDWAYRWEAILRTIGLEPMQQLLYRKERLHNLAKQVSSEESGGDQAAVKG